jgi:hypothetical protein
MHTWQKTSPFIRDKPVLLSERMLLEDKTHTHTDPQHLRTKWVTFTYSGKEVITITKLFQHITHSLTHSLMEPSPSWEAANCAATRELPSILRIKIALHTQNTIQNILKLHAQIDEYNRGVFYQMKYLNCPRKISDKQEKRLMLDIKNIFTPSETRAAISDIQITY